jgi:hypothetical protein
MYLVIINIVKYIKNKRVRKKDCGKVVGFEWIIRDNIIVKKGDNND